jgi:hypothetical protein
VPEISRMMWIIKRKPHVLMTPIGCGLYSIKNLR